MTIMRRREKKYDTSPVFYAGILVNFEESRMTDHWGECPQCKAMVAKEVEAIFKKADATYGNVLLEEFLANKAAANAEVAKIMARDLETFGEDYEIGLNKDGSFSLSYTGACSRCGASFKYAFEILDAADPKSKTYTNLESTGWGKEKKSE
jgi:hypothetical protein